MRAAFPNSLRTVHAGRLLAYLAMLLLVPMKAGGQQPKAHPAPISEKEAGSSETCLTCHDTLTKTKFVHSAVKDVGCTACHEIKTEDENTTVSLLAEGNELCLVCHEDKRGSEASPIHPLTVKIACITCHDPHGSEFAAQTRAATNALCLQCHGERNVTGDTVTLFEKQTLQATEFNKIPKLVLDRSRRIGHPFLEHPVGDQPDPSRKGEKLSCLSCHVPHVLVQPRLLRAEWKEAEVCDRCHPATTPQTPWIP